MRVLYGGSEAGTTEIDGQVSQVGGGAAQPLERSTAKSVRRITRINGQRIYFRDLAVMAWPNKTEANVAFIGRVDVRTARRWLADESDPPADVLGILLAEIMRRYGQR